MKLKTIAGLTALILLSEPAYQGIRNSINSYISGNKTETSSNLEQSVLHASSKKTEKKPKYVKLNDSNFKKEVLDYEGNCIVLFYDSNKTRSPPSARMKKVLDELIKEYADRIKFCEFEGDKVNRGMRRGEDAKKMKDLYNVIAYPTTAIYKNGEKKDSLRGCPDWETNKAVKWFREKVIEKVVLNEQ